MGPDPHSKALSGADVSERQRELMRSLRAAVDTLSMCAARIDELIARVDRQLSVGAEALALRAPTQVGFGGGASVIGSAGSEERRRGSDRRVNTAERRRSGDRRMPRRSERRAPGTPALMAATEMAHLGYSREEIAERLRARWGDRAAAILSEALD